MFTIVCIVIFALFYIWAVFSLFASAETNAGGIAILVGGVILAVPLFYLAYAYIWILLLFGCVGLLFLKS